MLLATQIQELRRLSHELSCLCVSNETPFYADRFRQLHTEIMEKADALLTMKGTTDEEEAFLCLALLSGYEAALFNQSGNEAKKQIVLDRSWNVLDHLPASLLKCQLLVSCYAEVFDEELAREAHTIMERWNQQALSQEQIEVMAMLKVLEENPYPWREIE